MAIFAHPGPPGPFSSAPDAGLWHDRQCWKWRSGGRGVLGTIPLEGMIPTEGQALRLALFGSYLDGEPNPFRAAEITIAIVASGGSRLSSAHDQHGHPITPDHRLPCLVIDQWNCVDIDVETLLGKKLERLEVIGLDELPATGWIQVSGLVGPFKPPVNPVDWVDTRRGTHSSGKFSRGNTIPATALPNGFNFLTPVTHARTTQWLYEWHAPSSPRLQGVAVSHQPSPWIRDRGQLQFMPFIGAPAADPDARSLAFDHESETAHPHHYHVELAGGLSADLVPTSHAGIISFGYPEDDSARGFLVDVPRGGNVATERSPDGRLTFSGWIEGDPDSPGPDAPREDTRRTPRSFFHGVTDLPAHEVDIELAEGGVQVAIQLDDPSQTHVEIRMATSWISALQARHNLLLEAPDDTPRGTLLRAASDRWNDLLSRAHAEGGRYDQLVTLYSNLYRMFLYPNEHSENVGTQTAPDWRFASPYGPMEGSHTEDHTGCRIVRGKLLVNNGYWDTYRTCWPAYHLLAPDLARTLVRGILTQSTDGGWMARWCGPGYIDCMVGTSSDTIFADASSRGLLDERELEAFDSAIRNVSVPSRDPRVGRKGLQTSRYVGYLDSTTRAGLSWTLETTVCDAAIGTWAASLASRNPEHPRAAELSAWAAYLTNRSKAHELLFDEVTGFFRGRQSDGSWSHEPFDPLVWGIDYVETNAWGMLFTPVHDGRGLAALLGGRDALRQRLETLLTTPETASALLKGGHDEVSHEMREARATRMGLLALTNQPAHHIPFMFAHTNAPWRTGEVTRDALDRLFVGSEIGQGYPGDEDNGELSAWWLLAALGIYPLMPGSGEFVLTAPLFPSFTWQLPSGRQITVTADNPSGRIIQSVDLNGAPWPHVTVPAAALAEGCHLHFVLGDTPTAWGIGSYPKSLPATRRFHPDLAGGAAVLTSNVRGVDCLTDDRARSAVVLAAGDWLEFSSRQPIGLITLTGSGRSVWHLEVDGRAVGPASEHELEPQQLLPFLVEPVHRGRVVFDSSATIHQVELYPVMDGGSRR